jgi:hypothetical protein
MIPVVFLEVAWLIMFQGGAGCCCKAYLLARMGYGCRMMPRKDSVYMYDLGACVRGMLSRSCVLLLWALGLLMD